MRLPRSLLLLTFAGATGIGACFGDQVSPPTFRNVCEVDADCRDHQVCVKGLCERPCTQATAVEDCPNSGRYAGCINGACASLCELPSEGKKDPCAAPATCWDLGLPGAGGGGGDRIGACVTPCTEDSCPENEVCVQGFCAASCTTDGDCQSGLVCLLGICAPDPGEDPTSTSTSTGGGRRESGPGGTRQ